MRTVMVSVLAGETWSSGVGASFSAPVLEADKTTRNAGALKLAPTHHPKGWRSGWWWSV